MRIILDCEYTQNILDNQKMCAFLKREFSTKLSGFKVNSVFVEAENKTQENTGLKEGEQMITETTKHSSNNSTNDYTTRGWGSYDDVNNMPTL